MESIVFATGVTRLILIVGVLLVNAISFVSIACCAKSRVRCVHAVTTAVIVLSSIVYLTSWLPYLTFSLPDSKWPLTNAREHCVIQQSVTSQVTTILLSSLVVRKLFDCFTPKVAKIVSFSTVIAWIIPQLVYFSTIEALNGDRGSFRFLDKLLLIPHSTNAANNSGDHLTIGFMLCVHHLAAPVVAQLSWHYVVIVIPLTAIVLLSFILQAFKKSNAGNVDDCNCAPDLLVSLCLYFNLMWLLILRPLIVLQTLMVNKQWQQSATYLDFGAHLVIIFAAVFVPFSNNAGLRNIRRSNKCNNNNALRAMECDSRKLRF